MQSDFEKDMQHRMEDFHVSPSAQVWRQVEAALPKEKKRKFLFWWLVPGLLLLGAASWLLLSRQAGSNGAGKQLTTTENTQAPVASNNTNPAGEIVQDTILPKTVDKLNPSNTNSPSKQKAPATISINRVSPGEAQHKSELTSSGHHTPAGQNKITDRGFDDISLQKATPGQSSKAGDRQLQSGGANETTTVKVTERKIDISTNKQPTPASGQQTDPAGLKVYQDDGEAGKKMADSNGLNVTTSPLNPGNNSALQPPLSPEKASSSASTPGDTSSNSPDIIKKVLQAKIHPVMWKLNIGVGISNTRSPIPGIGEKSLDRNAYSSNNTSGSGSLGSAFSGTAVKADPGFSLLAGLEREQIINRHFAWTSGVQYAYLSNSQPTGPARDSSVAFDRTSNVSRFYYPGSSTRQKNTVHRLGLQVGLIYLVNPFSKHTLSAHAGLAADWQFATSQLLEDPTRRIYFYYPSQTRQFTTGARLGIGWTLFGKCTAGAGFQYNFSGIGLLNSTANHHWQVASLSLQVPLGKTKSHK